MSDSIKPKMNEHIISQPKYSRGTNWTKTNVNTILIWLDVAINQIKLLDYAIVCNRKWIRNNIIFGLALSTASGTLSASNISISSSFINLIVNIIFTSMSFIIAIMSGYIKVYQIQENLEKYIKIKQDWIVFCIGIITELDLPIRERMDALDLINKNKDKYLELLKSDYDIDNSTKNKYAKKYAEINIKEEDLEKNSKNIQKKDFPSILASTIFRLQLEFKYLETDDAEEKINIIINSKLRPRSDKPLEKPTRFKLSNNKESNIAESETYKFKMWQNVKVNYHNGGTWFNGKICRNYDNMTYDITYEDGEKEENVSGSLIKPCHKFKNEQLIEVKKSVADNCSMTDDNNWIIGVIINMQEDGTYKIRLNDNKIMDNVEESSIREYYKDIISPPKFGQEARVKVLISENSYYGYIDTIILPKNNNENEIMYNIILDTGTMMNNIMEKNISNVVYCKYCPLKINDIIDYINDGRKIYGSLVNINDDDTLNISINGEVKKNISKNYIKKHHTSQCKLPSEGTNDYESITHETEESKKNYFTNNEETVIGQNNKLFRQNSVKNIPSSPKKRRPSIVVDFDKNKMPISYNAVKKYVQK